MIIFSPIQPMVSASITRIRWVMIGLVGVLGCMVTVGCGLNRVAQPEKPSMNPILGKWRADSWTLIIHSNHTFTVQDAQLVRLSGTVDAQDNRITFQLSDQTALPDCTVAGVYQWVPMQATMRLERLLDDTCYRRVEALERVWTKE